MRDDTQRPGRRDDDTSGQYQARSRRDDPRSPHPRDDGPLAASDPFDPRRAAARDPYGEDRAGPRAAFPPQRPADRPRYDDQGRSHNGEVYDEVDEDTRMLARAPSTRQSAAGDWGHERTTYQPDYAAPYRPGRGSFPANAATRTPSKPQNKRQSWFARRFPSRRQRRAVVVVATVLIVLIACMPVGLSAYFTYSNAKALALDGVRHLEAVKAKLPASTSDLSSALNQQTLDAVKPDIQAAQRDFQQLSDQLDGSPLIGLGAMAPSISGKVVAAKRLAHIGLDITKLANVLVGSGSSLVTILHNSPLSATKPVITQPDLDAFGVTVNTAEQIINDIAAQAAGISFGSLLAPAQSQILTKFLNGLPQIHQTFGSIRQFLQIAPMLMSIGHPASYLVITMDRSELRAGGGFQGNYAVATIQDGRLIDPLKLNDIYNLDEKAGNCWSANSVAPAAYQSWWRFNCWGVRDANLSADFPTSAKNAIRLFNAEGGPPINGVIALTPKIIEQLLAITGPIKMPDFNVTVDQNNLETTIHQFQLTHTGINQESDLPPVDQLSSVRKRFTANLGQVLQARLHGLPQNEMVALFKGAIDDMKTKDVQFYSTDPQVEQFLTQQNVSAQIQRGPGDGLFVVDSNLSGKQNTYVAEAISDAVQLDASGTATHTLKVTYNFINPTNAPTYGYAGTLYRDYVRIYVPPQSTFVANSGWTIQSSKSDEPQRAMWAGQILIDQNSGPHTITLTYKVPGAVAAGQLYTYTVQKQAGNHTTFALTVTHAGASKPALTFATATKPTVQYLESDKSFTVQ